jgi:hypothetical protein
MALAKYFATKRAAGPGPEQQQQHQGGGWLGWLRGAAGGGGNKQQQQQGAGSGGGAPAAGDALEADMGADEWQKLAELALQSEVGGTLIPVLTRV